MNNKKRMMKKNRSRAGLYSLCLLACFSALLLGACSSPQKQGVGEQGFELSGTLKNAGQTEKIFLYEGNEVVDSAALEGGEFFISRVVEEPALYTLLAGNRPYIFVLGRGEEVSFEADLADTTGTYSVSGSEISGRLVKLAEIQAGMQQDFANLEKEFMKRTESGEDMETVRNELLEQNLSQQKEASAQILHFAQENKDNLAGFYGMLLLYTLDPSGSEEALIKYTEELDGKFSGNEMVQSFVEHIAVLKPLSVGNEAPDFELENPDGQKVKLSDFRGKYVLLDFWASWCAPCRQENPNIVEQYHRFKDRNFTVLGVSLDRERGAWLKAIEDDGLDWTHVSDLQYWESEVGKLYNISAIPASFIIDPEGKIVAKNLRGRALQDFLEEKL